jgi:[acyl-carrier-protein] S-malonyltransferase
MKSKTALVFPGQGSQVVGMGKDLYDNFSCAKDIFQAVDDILKINLSRIVFEGSAEELTKTQNAQPALMAVSVAIVAVLESEFGKKVEEICDFVAGHSLGEYSALCSARAITLEETAKLLQIRGAAMAKCGQKTEGAMAAILGVDIDVAEEIVNEARQGEVCQVANDNSVGQIVISGSKYAIERAVKVAKTKGAKRALILPVSGAFHSSLMDFATSEVRQALLTVDVKRPVVPLVANITALETLDPKEIKELLIKQITGSVRWRETILFMEKNGVEEIIEVGAGKVLSGLVGRTCKNIKTRSIQSLEDMKNFS